jgi:hypothetical protein
MKLNKNYIIHKTDSETILVPTGEADFAGIVRGNLTLDAILELLKQETDEAAVMAVMKARFDAPDEVITGDVKKALAELRKIGALDE